MDPVSTLVSTANQQQAAQTPYPQAQTATFDAALGLLLSQNRKPAAQKQNAESVQAFNPQSKLNAKRREGAQGTAESTPDIAAMNAAQLASRPAPSEVAQADANVLNKQSANAETSSREQTSTEPKSTLAAQQQTSKSQSTDCAQPTTQSTKSQPTTTTSAAAQPTTNQQATPAPTPNQSPIARIGTSQSTPSITAMSAAKASNGNPSNGNSSSTQNTSSNNIAQPPNAKPTTAFKSLLAQAQPVRHAVQQREVQATALRAMQLSLTGNGGDVTLRMNPGDLGTLYAKLTVQDARVNADFVATTEVARDLLNQSVDALRSALETRGLSVDQITISGPEGQSTVHSGQDAQNLAYHERGGAANTSTHAGTDSQSRSDGDGSRARTPNRQLVTAHAETPPLWSIASEATSTANGLEWIV